MNMTTKTALAAVALAAGMISTSAYATQLVANTPIDSLVSDWTAGYGHAFDSGVAGNTFVDTYNFTSDSSAYLVDSFLHSTPAELTVTAVGIHDALTHALVGTAGIEVDATNFSSPATGTGLWRFSNITIAANTGYYLEVDGKVLSNTGTVYAGTINLTPTAPVPEPGTYAMLLAGLGMVGFLRRRKAAK